MIGITCRPALAQDAGATPQTGVVQMPAATDAAGTQRAPWAAPAPSGALPTLAPAPPGEASAMPPLVPATTSVSTSPAAAAPSHAPLAKRWWFWTAIGAVVAAAAVTVFFVTRTPAPPGCPTGQGYICP